jgi:acyl carrier protein
LHTTCLTVSYDENGDDLIDMDSSTALLQLDEILELAPGTLTGTEQLADLAQWDSVTMMDFIAMASDRQGITLSARQLNPCVTVSDLISLIVKD